MSRNYTIDYEEYWNRSMVGCAGTSYCTNPSQYGNYNWHLSVGNNTIHDLYHCTSDTAWVSDIESPYVYLHNDSDRPEECMGSAVWWGSGYQSYGQYKALFLDVKDDVDTVTGAVKDDDDVDLWDHLPIFNSAAQKELYLISHDKTQRMYIRRKLVGSGDWNRDGLTGKEDTENLYTLQILQLRGFDAGSNHDFDQKNHGVYDGQIDTWACDYGAGFICAGTDINDLYTWYKLPSNGEDGWINLLPSDVTVSDRNVIVSPNKDPQLAWKDTQSQISPYIIIQITTKLYGKNWMGKIPLHQMELYTMRLQTLLSLPNLGVSK